MNTTVAGDQRGADIAMNPAGVAVVVWQSQGQDGSGWGICARRYDAAGTAAGVELRVNTTVAGDQDAPSVAVDGLGGFVVCWRGLTSTGARSGCAQANGGAHFILAVVGYFE